MSVLIHITKQLRYKNIQFYEWTKMVSKFKREAYVYLERENEMKEEKWDLIL